MNKDNDLRAIMLEEERRASRYQLPQGPLRPKGAYNDPVKLRDYWTPKKLAEVVGNLTGAVGDDTREVIRTVVERDPDDTTVAHIAKVCNAFYPKRSTYYAVASQDKQYNGPEGIGTLTSYDIIPVQRVDVEIEKGVKLRGYTEVVGIVVRYTFKCQVPDEYYTGMLFTQDILLVDYKDTGTKPIVGVLMHDQCVFAMEESARSHVQSKTKKIDGFDYQSSPSLITHVKRPDELELSACTCGGEAKITYRKQLYPLKKCWWVAECTYEDCKDSISVYSGHGSNCERQVTELWNKRHAPKKRKASTSSTSKSSTSKSSTSKSSTSKSTTSKSKKV